MHRSVPPKRPPFLAIALGAIMFAALLYIGIRVAGRNTLPTGSRPVAVLVGDADRDFHADYTQLAGALAGAGRHMVEVAANKVRIPPEAGVLLVLGAHSLDESAIGRIRDFNSGGGAVFIAHKGVEIVAGERLSARVLPRSPVDGFLEGLGIAVGRSLVLGTDALEAPFQERDGEIAGSYPYHHWFRIGASIPGNGASIPVTMLWPSPVSVSRGTSGKSVIPLRADPRARSMASAFILDPPEAMRWFDSGGGEDAGGAPLAVFVPGDKSRGIGRVAVTGSSDIAGDLARDAGSQGNMDFLLACIRWLEDAR